MELTTNKNKGNTGLSMAIAYFGAHGYTVSIPLNDTQDYDLVVDNGTKLQKVQVKCTCYRRDGSYVVSLKSSGGTKGLIYKRLIETNIDLLFAFCGDGTMFVIPKEVIKTKNSINLRKEPSKFKQSNCIDYSKYLVSL